MKGAASVSFGHISVLPEVCTEDSGACLTWQFVSVVQADLAVDRALSALHNVSHPPLPSSTAVLRARQCFSIALKQNAREIEESTALPRWSMQSRAFSGDKKHDCTFNWVPVHPEIIE